MATSFNPVQNHILSKLKNAKSLRYSDLQPDGIPNDLFNYHLQYLVKKEFVYKKNEGYSLAPAGIKHVADPDVLDENLKIASLFKVNVITIASRLNKGKLEILNQVRKSHPSYGKIGVMGGIVRKGEALEAAATRKFKTETGLDGTFTILGIERRRMYIGGKLFSDVIFPITYCDDVSGKLLNVSDFGENLWVPIDQAIKNDSAPFDSIQSIPKVLKALKTKKKIPFFYIETTQEK